MARRAVALLALAPLLALATPPAAAAQPAGAGSRTDHVLIISLDGLRPDAIDRYRLGTLRRLMAEGRHSLEARTVLPSTTLPSHTSMLTGVPPAVHGITWNTYIPGRGVVGVPTIFELARAEGHQVAAFYAKAKLRHLDRPGSYDHRVAPLWNVDRWMATDVVPEAVLYLRHHRPNLMLVHIAEPDHAGHIFGWMGRLYGVAARRADAAVEELLAAAEAAFGSSGFTVIVTADHGGRGRGHGSAGARDRLIPWIAHGRGVVPGPTPERIRTVDTAATVLWLLGVPLPPWLEGRPITEAFTRLPNPGPGSTSGPAYPAHRCE
jgi:predicted AlkP superfamily pyrophosphatase or phosphodiesterase